MGIVLWKSSNAIISWKSIDGIISWNHLMESFHYIKASEYYGTRTI